MVLTYLDFCRLCFLLLSEDGSPGRKDWIDNRLKELDGIFAISVGGFCIMDNHLHFLLRIDVEQAYQWSAMEVAKRWMALYLPRASDRKPLKVTDEFLELKADNAAWVIATRKRLSSLGWFMKCLKEPLARLANKQDGCTGAFFEGRYKSIAIHGGSVFNASGLHEPFGRRRQSVGNSGS